MFSWYEKMMFRLKTGQELWNDVQIFNFFESPAKRGLRIGIALVLILAGLGLFLWQLDDVAAYEQSCRNPIVVEAVIDVEVVDGTYNNEYISYICDGVRYDRVHWDLRKSWMSLERDGQTMLVTLDPRNHGKFARDMVDGDLVFGSLVIAAMGLAALVYGVILGNEKLRRMLVRLGPQKCKDRDEPDYVVDMAMLTVLIYIVVTIAMWCVFPLSVGFAPTLAGGMILVVGAAAKGISMSLDRHYRRR